MKEKKRHTGKRWRRLTCAVHAAALLAAGVLGILFWRGDISDAQAAASLSNPRIAPDNSMEAGQKVTWDCVWFGSYPQAEVIPSGVEYTALDESQRRDGDVIVSDSVYRALQGASGWDVNNDIILNGAKYRRMKKKDATYATSGDSNYYNWSSSTDYHYFKYEPIKWRVLHADGNQALILSDVALDDKRYHAVLESITWETSTVRSWLNGYGAGSNQQSVDYSRKSFIGSAFTASEQAAIVNSFLENADSIQDGTSGGNATTDKIFFLSESDVWNTNRAKSYGYVKDRYTYDEARRCKGSAYAKAMGMWNDTTIDYAGNGVWWLRSPGYNSSCARYVYYEGQVRGNGYRVNNDTYGVRPALNLNLSSPNLYAYAGTVCSGETINKCTVTFHANGGSCATPNKSVTCGNAYGTLPTPTRSGYTFTGWYTAVSGGAWVRSSTMVNTALDHTLYARWSANTYRVSFNANGGSCATPNKSVTCGNAYGTLPTPIRSGYTFTGWYTAVSGGALVKSSATVNTASEHTLYAHWTENQNPPTPSTESPTPSTEPSTPSPEPFQPSTEPPARRPNQPNPPAPAVDWKALAKKNNKKTVESSNISLKSASGVTEADKYLSLGKIKPGKKRFTLKLEADGVKNLSYKSSNKKTASVSSKGVVKIRGIGKTTLTVTGTLSSTGKRITKKYTLTVNPDKTSLSSVKAAGAGTIKILWKKNRSGEGYEICYSISKSFKSGSKSFLVPQKYTTVTLKGLMRKAKYYVRIRSYKVVSGKPYYSAWSKTKTVKVK